MGVIGEFRKFVMRGSLVDMAVGFTVGAAFTTVAKSLVDDIIMPPIGLLVGNVDFKDLFWILKSGADGAATYATIDEAQRAGAVTLNYGRFINNALALLIVAVVIFIVIRLMNRAEETLEQISGEKSPQPDEPAHKKCPFCRSTIAFRAMRCPQCTSHLEPDEPPSEPNVS